MKLVLLWLLNAVDLYVNVEDGVLSVELCFRDARVFHWSFDVNQVMGAPGGASVTQIGRRK